MKLRLVLAWVVALFASVGLGFWWGLSQRTAKPAGSPVVISAASASAENGDDRSNGAAKSEPALSTEAAREMAEGINPADPKGALASLRQVFTASRNNARGQAAIWLAVEKWSPADLQAAAIELGKGRYIRSSADDSLRHAILSRWAEVSPEEALALVKEGMVYHWESAVATFGQLAITQPQEMESALSGMPGHKKRNALMAAAAAMAESNPQAAVAFVRRHKGHEWSGAFYSLLSAWAAKDPEGAAQFALAEKSGQLRENTLSEVCASLASAAPQRAWAFASSLPKLSEKFNLQQRVISSLAARDPRAALAMLEREPGRDRSRLIETVASNWGMRDPKAALEWIQTFSDASERARCLSSIADTLHNFEPENGFLVAAMLPQGSERRSLLREIAERFASSDPQLGLELINGLPEADKVAALEKFTAGLAQSDPQMALELVATLPPTDGTRQAQVQVARALVDEDVDKALDWAGNLETERARIDATSAALTAWADREPDKAAEATGRLADANARRKAREEIAGTWANRSPKEAEAWAASLPVEDRFSALAAVWKTTAKDDPRSAAEQVASQLDAAASVEGASDKLAGVATQAASAWCGRNPNEAAAWSLSLPEGKVREQAIAGVAKQWAEFDTVAASEWIAQLPEGTTRDQAAAPLINKIASSDPESAFAWASSVHDADKRVELLKTTLTTWKGFNPAAARQALESSALPDEVKGRVQDVVK